MYSDSGIPASAENIRRKWYSEVSAIRARSATSIFSSRCRSMCAMASLSRSSTWSPSLSSSTLGGRERPTRLPMPASVGLPGRRRWSPDSRLSSRLDESSAMRPMGLTLGAQAGMIRQVVEEHPDELFAARLNHLFEVVRRPGGSRWENSEVGPGAGCPRPAAQPRNPKQSGSRSRGPTWETINALASFFKVEPTTSSYPPPTRRRVRWAAGWPILGCSTWQRTPSARISPRSRPPSSRYWLRIQRIEAGSGVTPVTGDADRVDGRRWTAERHY